MNPLSEWLRRKKLRPVDFAKAHGISAPTLSRILADKSVPSLKTAFAIEDATKGRVKARAWVK